MPCGRPSHKRVSENGFVTVQLTVGVDGIPRDPEIQMAVPNTDYSAAAIATLMPARLQPATRSGHPIESKLLVKVGLPHGRRARMAVGFRSL